MHKHHAVFLAVMTAVSGFALADEPANTPNADAQVLRGTNQTLPQADGYDLISKAETTFSAWYYGRDRQEQAATDRGDIKVNVINLGLNFKSGYAWDKVGFDVAAHTAQKIGETKGWSEILRHEDGVSPKDESYSVISQAAIKFRQNADGQGLATRIGYTPISVGTLGTSGGLQSHAYRGAEVKYKTGDLELGYGWADQFRNEWDDRFRNITNQWHQNRGTNDKGIPHIDGKQIEYVNSLGLRYAPKDGFVDIGIGEGKDYRRNAQIAGGYTWNLAGGDKLTATGYLFTAKNITQLSGDTDPKNEYHASGSVSYATGGLTLLGGLGYTHNPANGASNELNFRLAPWANSDNRNFIQTWGQLDDFVWDGQTVIKLSASYDFAKLGLPGFSAGISGNYATGAKYKNEQGQNVTAKFSEVDLSFGYAVQSGVLKGASIGIYPAWLKTDKFDQKSDRSDVKVVANYTKTF